MLPHSSSDPSVILTLGYGLSACLMKTVLHRIILIMITTGVFRYKCTVSTSDYSLKQECGGNAKQELCVFIIIIIFLIF